MLIRPMLEADVDAVLDIEQAVQAHPWTRGQFLDSLPVHGCSVAEEAGALCGFAVVMPLPDEAELLNLGVAPARQRAGIGRRLLQAVLDEVAAQGRTRVHLEVRAGNMPALGLYQAMDFQRVGLRKGYYPAATGHEDAVLMAREVEVGRAHG